MTIVTRNLLKANRNYTGIMTRTLFTTLELFCLMTWLQATGGMRLAYEPLLHNDAAVLAFAFAAGLCACAALAGRLDAAPGPRASLAIGALAAACELATALPVADALRAAALCVEFAALAVLVARAAFALAQLAPARCSCVVCVAALCSAAAVLALGMAPTWPVPAAVALPLVAGACPLARSHAPRTAPPCEQEPSRAAGKLVPIVTLVCVCAFAASGFEGVVAAPYLASSRAIETSAAVLTLAATLLFALASVLAARRPAQSGSPPDALALAFTALSVIVLVVGALLLSTQVAGTMIRALALVVAGKNCLYVVFWMVAPRLCATARVAMRRFAALVLASGMLYATFAGICASMAADVGFSGVTSLSTALIAIIAAAAVVFACVHPRNAARLAAAAAGAGTGAGQAAASAAAEPTPAAGEPSTGGQDTPAPAPEGGQALSLQDLQSALREQQQLMLEPYGLTEREREVVMLLLDGQTMGGVAEKLFITERTVKFHSRNAYDKMGVSSKKELMQKFSKLDV